MTEATLPTDAILAAIKAELERQCIHDPNARSQIGWLDMDDGTIAVVDGDVDLKALAEAIATALAPAIAAEEIAAVEAEREACAERGDALRAEALAAFEGCKSDICRAMTRTAANAGKRIADEIRARGKA